MKAIKLFLFSALLILAASFTVSAQRVLTDEERQSLITDTHFIQKCEFAAKNYASYWSVHDGSGLATEAARIKWAKDRIVGVNIVKSGVRDSQAAERFVTLGKALQFSIGAAPQSVETIIAAWIAGNRFDELSSQYFDIIGDSQDMSVSGN